MPAQASTSPPQRVADAGVLLEGLEDGILRLTLNRPKASNALSEELLDALEAAVKRAGSDPDVRVVVVAAEGPQFCGGHDLKQMTAHRSDADEGRAYFHWLFRRCTVLMSAIADSPRIFIAQVQGVATAAGCQLVAACDLAVASARARFGVNGIDVGLFCSTPMVPVSRALPAKRTFELLTTGRFMDAEEALASGLVNRVVAPESLSAETDALARTISSKSTTVLALGKRAFREQLDMPVADAYLFTADVIAENMMSDDAREGIDAFFAKRRPQWRDR